MHRMGIHPNGYDYLTTILAHSKSGQWVSSTYRLLLKDQTAQGQGSAITYGRRYSLQALLSMVTGEEDDDGENAMNRGNPPRKPAMAPKRPPVSPPKSTEASAPTPSTQENPKAQKRSSVPLGSHQDWPAHLVHAQEVCTEMGFSQWPILNSPRQRIVLARMREEKITDCVEFWELVRETLLPFDQDSVEGWSAGGKSLETFIRIPLRGTPDHFTKAKEGHYKGKQPDTLSGPSALELALEEED